MGRRSAAGCGAASSCTSFTALAVNSSRAPNTRAMIREIAVARSLSRSKVALIAAARSGRRRYVITPSIAKPVPKSEPWPSRPETPRPTSARRAPTAERSSAAPANQPLRRVAAASKKRSRTCHGQGPSRTGLRDAASLSCSDAPMEWLWARTKRRAAIGIFTGIYRWSRCP